MPVVKLELRVSHEELFSRISESIRQRAEAFDTYGSSSREYQQWDETVKAYKAERERRRTCQTVS